MAEEVTKKAREGDFDRNRMPRLYHRVRCEKCRSLADKYIDYLRKGEFEIGAQQQVSVIQTVGYYSYRETERVTPIYIKLECERCGHESKITDPILSLEYLLGVTRRFREAPSAIYV